MSASACAAAASVADSGHVNPSLIPLRERALIKGQMWTARGPLPFGPRPGQADNCLCPDEFEQYSPADQDTFIALYGPNSPRKNTHAPMGPMVDAGYHGYLPSCDFRNDPTPYFDGAQKLEDAGIRVAHFLRPDRGCAGLEWTVEDLDRELGPIFRAERAQRLMSIVVLAWEPGPKYYYDNAWWVAMCQWMARTFPNALRLIHLVADLDAPTGQDDDKKGLTNGQCWANVAPYIHGFLNQSAGYFADEQNRPVDRNAPTWPAYYAQFKVNFADAIRRLVKGFEHGYGGWPTFSAWGDTEGIWVYSGENASYPDFWENWPESESIEIGDIAMANGAKGYLDGGTAR